MLADSPTKIEIPNSNEAAQKLEALKKEKQQLQLEQKQNKDLIFIHGIEDSYANLHFKVLFILYLYQKFLVIYFIIPPRLSTLIFFKSHLI